MSTARRLIKLGGSIKLKKKESEKPDYGICKVIQLLEAIII
jgi:hypothetical protein